MINSTHIFIPGSTHTRTQPKCVHVPLSMHFNLCDHWLLNARTRSPGAYLTTIFRFSKKDLFSRSENELNFDTNVVAFALIFTCHAHHEYHRKWIRCWMVVCIWLPSTRTVCFASSLHSNSSISKAQKHTHAHIWYVSKGAQPTNVNCVLLHWVMTF